MKHILLIFSLFLLNTAVVAVNDNNDKNKPAVKNVSGKVISLNGEEIPGAKITVKETNETFFAELDGTFRFQLKSDRNYSVLVETIGYEPLEIGSAELHLFSEISLKELK